MIDAATRYRNRVKASNTRNDTKRSSSLYRQIPINKSLQVFSYRDNTPAREVPPGVLCKEKRKKLRILTIDYYYGNAATFWKIMKQVYPKSLFNNVSNIQKWQEKYCIGIVDTVRQCRRKDPCSYKDSDLIVDWEDYNHSLKDYVSTHKNTIEKLIFTSGENINSALTNFKKIMGDQFHLVADKVISDLPSPSGGSNTSNFNSNNATLGLSKPLYEYLLLINVQSDIDYVQKQWTIKQAAAKGEIVNRIPKKLLTAFKIWKYKQVFPLTECVS